MGFFSRAWSLISFGITVYSVYSKVNQALQAKDAFYQELPPDLQTEYANIFGEPGPAQISNPTLPAYVPSAAAQATTASVLNAAASAASSPVTPVTQVQSVAAGA